MLLKHTLPSSCLALLQPAATSSFVTTLLCCPSPQNGVSMVRRGGAVVTCSIISQENGNQMPCTGLHIQNELQIGDQVVQLGCRIRNLPVAPHTLKMPLFNITSRYCLKIEKLTHTKAIIISTRFRMQTSLGMWPR